MHQRGKSGISRGRLWRNFETVTDHFGDFWFKGLEHNKPFTIKIEKVGYAHVEIKNIIPGKDW
jgi:hypothetical protein